MNEINYEYKTLVTLKADSETSKEWLYSVFPIEEGGYVGLPSYNKKLSKRTTTIYKILKVWEEQHIQQIS